jgi:acetylornithine deacetylase/succinyl-diaminopimelate desuccinylase-like protein
MFNGHMDTSYSGRESWLAHVPGFQPSAFVEDGRLYGLGISNMKGALACYVEALRALADAGVRLQGDVLIAAVSGEIEKAQWGDAQGAEFRGYATGTRHLVTHGGVADMCILGEPTESKIVLGHFGSLWLRISTKGPFIHTAFSEGKRGQNSILRMREVLDAVVEWIPTWEDDPENAYRGAKAIVNVGAVAGGFGWRVSRTPHRTDLFLDVRVPPTKEMAEARGQVLDLVRELKAQGASIIIISHRLEDIYAVSDRLVVMRLGRRVRDTPVTGNLDDFRGGVVAYMIGARDDFAAVTVP